MPSFTRTIPKYKTIEEVETVLIGRDGFVPLTFRPGRAGRGIISTLFTMGSLWGGRGSPGWCRHRLPGMEAGGCRIGRSGWSGTQGGWERPPREIAVQGHQGVRYLEEQGLGTLDDETWQAITA